MAGERDAEVDPRFDPVFQRGYDPTVHGEHRPRTARGNEPVRAPFESLQDRAAPEHTDVPPRGRPAAEAPAPRPERQVAHDPAGAEPVAQPEPVAAHRNPFLLALLIASVLAIGAAALIMWRQINDPYRYGATGTDVGAQFLQQFSDSLLVPLLTGGVIGLTLWLSIGALRRREVIARVADESER